MQYSVSAASLKVNVNNQNSGGSNPQANAGEQASAAAPVVLEDGDDVPAE